MWKPLAACAALCLVLAGEASAEGASDRAAGIDSESPQAAARRLQALGYQVDPLDPASLGLALRRFQSDRGLEVDGQLSPETAEALADARVPTETAVPGAPEADLR